MNYRTLAIEGHESVRIFADDKIYGGLEQAVFDQARNTACTCGVEQMAILPDAHQGYGAPIGSVVVTSDRVIPGPVGYDIGCGMALYLTDVQASMLKDRNLRRGVIAAIDRGIAMGEGKQAIHGVELTDVLVEAVLNRGAHALVERDIVPRDWLERCERAVHAIPPFQDGVPTPFTLGEVPPKARRGFQQLGTLGGGNHFIELQEIRLPEDESLRAIARQWGMFEGQLAIMVHSGSRGFGHGLGEWAFAEFKTYNDSHGESYSDRELVHAPISSAIAKQYMRFVAAGANFALVNRLLMARVVKRSVEDVLPKARVALLYEISHNLAQWEPDASGHLKLIHRKGTTRAFPAHHPMLEGTMWAGTGHPVITPGSMGTYSAIQVGLDGAAASFYSINHGAGRRMSRAAAKRLLDQGAVDAELEALDILVNQRHAPLDEAPAVYKDMDDVLAAVKYCGLAAVVARCYPMGSMKGHDEPAGSHRKQKKGAK
jgi:tRNA-splicing ligase RtcB